MMVPLVFLTTDYYKTVYSSTGTWYTMSWYKIFTFKMFKICYQFIYVEKLKI
jgi:hypothetical protein